MAESKRTLSWVSDNEIKMVGSTGEFRLHRGPVGLFAELPAYKLTRELMSHEVDYDKKTERGLFIENSRVVTTIKGMAKLSSSLQVTSEAGNLDGRPYLYEIHEEVRDIDITISDSFGPGSGRLVYRRATHGDGMELKARLYVPTSELQLLVDDLVAAKIRPKLQVSMLTELFSATDANYYIYPIHSQDSYSAVVNFITIDL